MTSITSIHPILVGASIILKPITLIHVTPSYLAWLHDDEVMEGIATTGYTLENLREYVQARQDKREVAFYAIHAAQTDEHIGNIKLDFHDAKANVSELGLLIGNKNYWGKGVGKEACKMLLKYAFDTLQIRKIYLAVYEPNIAAKKLYENLGFKLEGTLRKHISIKGQNFDKYLMGIFKEELL